MSNAIKEIIILLLVILIVMLSLAIIMYTYLPNKKDIATIEEYVTSEEIQDSLSDNIDSKADSENKILYTYEVSAGDLNYYQQTDDYIPMKLNPYRDITDHEEVNKSVIEHVILEEESN